MSGGQERGGRWARDEPGSAEVSERDGALAYLEGRWSYLQKLKQNRCPGVLMYDLGSANDAVPKHTTKTSC